MCRRWILLAARRATGCQRTACVARSAVVTLTALVLGPPPHRVTAACQQGQVPAADFDGGPQAEQRQGRGGRDRGRDPSRPSVTSGPQAGQRPSGSDARCGPQTGLRAAGELAVPARQADPTRPARGERDRPGRQSVRSPPASPPASPFSTGMLWPGTGTRPGLSPCLLALLALLRARPGRTDCPRPGRTDCPAARPARPDGLPGGPAGPPDRTRAGIGGHGPGIRPAGMMKRLECDGKAGVWLSASRQHRPGSAPATRRRTSGPGAPPPPETQAV